MNRAFIVKKKWLDLILDGDKEGFKLWEVRGCDTKVRGRVGLIESGTGLIVGNVEITGSSLLLKEDFDMFRKYHKIPCRYEELTYKKPHVWYMKNPIRFKEPIPYKHPQGAVIWVKLEGDKSDEKTICIKPKSV